MYGEGEDGLDAHAGKDAAEKDGMTDLERQVDTVVAAALASPGCLLDAEGAVRIGAPARTTGGGHGKRSKSSRTAHASGSRSRNALASGTSRSRATHASSGSSKDNSRAATSRGSVANSTSGASGAGEGWGEATEGTDIMVARESSRVLSSRALLLSLRTVERAIQQNSYHSRHRLYRAVPGSEQELEQAKADERLRKAAAAGELGDIAEVTRAPAGAWQAQPLLLNPCGTTTCKPPGCGVALLPRRSPRGGCAPPPHHLRSRVSVAVLLRDGCPHTHGLTTDVSRAGEEKERVEKLWSYTCPLTRGRNVSCMTWNKVNKDLLAVSYGQFDFEGQADDGLIAFWSMKNPEYPECVLHTPAGVTTLDFSSDHPNLLAVGLYSGTVAIYDVRKAMAGETDGTPAMASAPLSGHTDAVWQVRWVRQGERGERLISISTDGRVKVWSMKKGLTCNGASWCRCKGCRVCLGQGCTWCRVSCVACGCSCLCDRVGACLLGGWG